MPEFRVLIKVGRRKKRQYAIDASTVEEARSWGEAQAKRIEWFDETGKITIQEKGIP